MYGTYVTPNGKFLLLFLNIAGVKGIRTTPIFSEKEKAFSVN